MMITRSIRLISQQLLRSHKKVNVLQPTRNAAWVYRSDPEKASKWEFLAADGLNALMWWWIFIHCYYQWGHVVGEYDYPQPEKWTDAELGIADVDVD